MEDQAADFFLFISSNDSLTLAETIIKKKMWFDWKGDARLEIFCCIRASSSFWAGVFLGPLLLYVSVLKVNTYNKYGLSFFDFQFPTEYRIVASTNTCYYSENQIFWFLKSRIVTCRNFFLGTKPICLLSKWAEKKDTWQTHDRTTFNFWHPMLLIELVSISNMGCH